MNLSTPCRDQSAAKEIRTIDFESIRALTKAETEAVDRLIINDLSSDVALINQISHYIVESGGKRLRPTLLLLASKALKYQGGHHITMAAVIEFIHTATLLHDDVVDESDLRRGTQTVNSVWGNAASVLVGDFLFSRAFEMMVKVNSMRVMEILSRTTTAIAEGEVLQLLNCNNPATTEERYLDVISRKTAILFSAANQLSAILAESSADVENALGKYGMHLGIAFQLIDDLLDYKADPTTLGKNLGDDLAEGKPTMPLINAIQKSPGKQAEIIKEAIRSGNRDAFADVYAIVESTNAIAYTERRANQEAQKAIRSLSILPASIYKEAMIDLAEFAVQRTY